MHTGNNYKFFEVMFWTRRDLYSLFFISAVPTSLYILLDWKWLSIPWLPIALLGTAVAFVVGFKNNASYERVWEARKIWGGIVNSSRSWGVLVKDYVSNHFAKEKLSDTQLNELHKELVFRHLAWITALRFQLREPRTWEAIYKAHNLEYKNKWFKIEEHEHKVEELLTRYLSENDLHAISGKTNKATQILALQSEVLKTLHSKGYIDDFRHMEMEKLLIEFLHHQGASERIKNFPYPRQYATLNLWFIKIFVLLLPLGMLQEFDKYHSQFVWLTIPFSMLSGWVFTTLEKIGEASENPFEGSANDVPITSISRNIEIDLMEMLKLKDVPPPIQSKNNILS